MNASTILYMKRFESAEYSNGVTFETGLSKKKPVMMCTPEYGEMKM